MLNGEQWTQLLLGFIEEASELTKQAEEYLLQLDASPTDEEALSGLFRAMHTIKGSAGLFSLTPLVSFTHHLENLLMAVRDGNGAGIRIDAGHAWHASDQVRQHEAGLRSARRRLPLW